MSRPGLAPRRGARAQDTFSGGRSPFAPEPSELPRGFGVRWLVGNRADTALEGCPSSKGKRCVPSPLTHRTPRRWRASSGWHWFRGAKRVKMSGSSFPERPPATLWQPCGLTDPECPIFRARCPHRAAGGGPIAHALDTFGGSRRAEDSGPHQRPGWATRPNVGDSMSMKCPSQDGALLFIRRPGNGIHSARESCKARPH